MKSWLLVLISSLLPASADFPFVIPGDDGTPGTATDMRDVEHGPAGAHGFVRIKEGRFHTDAGRLRFWGMNLCFGANFPTKDDAPLIAAHLAKIGVNAVRFHHHDNQDAPTGIWAKLRVNGKRVFDSEMVDRLDFFLAELHKQGIYADLNLHTSRELSPEEGFPNHNVSWPTSYNKYTMYFDEEIQAKLKDFCREFLLHRNPYRDGLRRVDDPAIALYEITNENAFTTRGPQIADQLPEPYRGRFVRQWNAWLKNKYSTHEALVAAWGASAEPEGVPLVDSSAWRSGAGSWVIHGKGMEPSFYPAGTASLAFRETVEKPWEQQVLHDKITIEQGKLYTLRFRHRSPEGRAVLSVELATGWPEPWKDRGLVESDLISGSEWTSFERSFRGEADDGKPARLCFNVGRSTGRLELADVALVPGGNVRVETGGGRLDEGTVGIPLPGRFPEPAVADVLAFMRATEIAFCREMIRFLKEELEVKAPISTSQINYHGSEIALAGGTEFGDMHAYWQHPLFPGRPWDAENWTIHNEAMEANPFSDTWPRSSLLARAGWRLHGLPFIFSEWNSGEPMIYGAGLVPTSALIAALQDWDGIFFFQYDQRNTGWFRSHFTDYFSFNGQPAKLAMFTAAAHLFRRGDVAPLPETLAGPLGDALVHASYAMSHQVGQSAEATVLPPVPDPPPSIMRTPDDSITWDRERGIIQCISPATRGVWGNIAEQSFDLGGIKINVGPCENDYACIILTSLDGKPVERSSRMLLTAVGRAENEGMQWNAEKTSVGTRWGHGPARVNGIPFSLVGLDGCRAFALDGTGVRITELPTLSFAPEYRTVWYELVR